MINNIEAFVELQLNANAEIDEHGEVSQFTANRLEEIVDSLSQKEIHDVVQLYNKIMNQTDK